MTSFFLSPVNAAWRMLSIMRGKSIGDKILTDSDPSFKVALRFYFDTASESDNSSGMLHLRRIFQIHSLWILSKPFSKSMKSKWYKLYKLPHNSSKGINAVQTGKHAALCLSLYLSMILVLIFATWESTGIPLWNLKDYRLLPLTGSDLKFPGFRSEWK